MTNSPVIEPVALPMCPPTDEGARDTRALLHILLVLGIVWAARALWRRARRGRASARG